MRNPPLGKLKLLLVLSLLGMVFFGLVACGKSNEEVIRESVTAQFESIKNLDEQSLDQMLEGFAERSDLEQFGIDSKEFYAAWLEGFDYSIDTVEVNGESATVTATITIKSLEEALTDWQSQFSELLQDESSANLSEEELYQKIGEMFTTSITNAPLKTTTVDLPYIYRDNTWIPDEVPYNNALRDAFVGNLS